MVGYTWAVCLLEQRDLHTDPWGQAQIEQGEPGNLHLVGPTTQVVLGEIHLQGMLGKLLDQPEGEIHPDPVHTSHCLLAARQGKARLDRGQREHQGQKETVHLGKERDLQVAAQEFLQRDTAQGTVQAPPGWRETDPELLEQEDIVQVFQDQQGSHQGQREVPGNAQAPRGRRGTGTAPVLLDQIIHR